MNNLKRYTFYILTAVDIVSILLSSICSFYISLVLRADTTYEIAVYQRFPLIAIIAYLVISILSLYKDENFLTRSTSGELLETLKISAYHMAVVMIYFFMFRIQLEYSRQFMIVYAILMAVIDWLLRTLVKKKVLPMYRNGSNAEKMLLIVPSDQVSKIVNELKNSSDWRYQVTGLIISDQDLKGETIESLPVVSNISSMHQDLLNQEVDSVMIVSGNESSETIQKWTYDIEKLGKKVHLRIKEYYSEDNSLKVLDNIGNTAVVTYYSIKPMSVRQSFAKRFLDILFSIILLPFFLLIFLITAVFEMLESPGSILTHRVRVGKNGRRFYLLRFRTYRLDAEERIQAGKSPYMGIGKFLRWSHLDGLPQLLNVLSGEMSFTGPKALSLLEYLDADAKTRSTRSIRPGIAGYWSIGKKDKDLLKADQDYISAWNIIKDIGIILVTFFRYLTAKSLRDKESWRQEELQFAIELNAERSPLAYDHSAYTLKQNSGYLFIKRLLDIILSLIAIIILSPLFVILTILVIADDGGSPLYGHHRIGKHGKRITIYKFRSMRRDAGDLKKLLTPEQLEQYQKEFKIDNDPRITKIGEFLRKTSLDELPQLFNVLGGSLSFVGPRPIIEEETKHYGKDVAKFLSVKPGLTGYWQAYARNNAVYETGERQKMEMYYVDHASLGFDIKIFFHTFGSVIREEGVK